jgi:hypothetical protein
MKSFEFMYRESGKDTLLIGQNLSSCAYFAPTVSTIVFCMVVYLPILSGFFQYRVDCSICRSITDQSQSCQRVFRAR